MISHLSGLNSPNWRERKQAVEALSKLNDTDLANALLDVISKKHDSLDALNAALQILNVIEVPVTQGLIKLLEESDYETRTYAALAIGQAKDPAAATSGVEALLRILKQEEICSQEINLCFNAIEALGRLRAASALDTLVNFTRGENYFLAFAAVTALGEIGEPHVAPYLIQLLNDNLLAVPAAQALGSLAVLDAIGPICAWLETPEGEASTAVSALSKILNQSEVDIEAKSGEFIGPIGIKKLLQLGEQKIVFTAGEEHNSYLPDLARVLGVLLKYYLESEEGSQSTIFEQIINKLIQLLDFPNVQTAAAKALAKGGERLLPILTRTLLESKENQIPINRCGIVQVLGEISSDLSIPALVTALDDEDEEVVISAAEALKKIAAKDAYDKLLARLDHPSMTVRRAIVEAAAAISPGQTSGHLLSLLNSANPIVRESALHLIAYRYPLDPRRDEAIATTLAALGDSMVEVRRAAVETLAYFDDPQIPSALAETIQDSDPTIRAASARVLVKMSPDFALPLLYKAFHDPDPWVRMYACRSVGIFGRVESFPHLQKLLTDPLPPVRAAAAIAFGNLGDQRAAEILHNMQSDPEPEVQKAAWEALERLKGIVTGRSKSKGGE